MFHARIRDDVELRLLEEAHAAALFTQVERNRAYLRRWLPWVDSTQTVDDTLAFVRCSLDDFQNGRTLVAGIWWNREMIGTIGLHKIDWPNRRLDIGYWLAEFAQGRGIMTACARVMTSHGFVEFGMNRVGIQAAIGNHKSRAIPERLGFQFEGIARHGEWLYDHFVDLAMYSMLAGDWKD